MLDIRKAVRKVKDAFDEDYAYVPELNNLETLIVSSGFEEDDSFLPSLLSLTPNLKHFSFVCFRESYVCETFLELITRNCPKLKTFKIKGNDGDEHVELEISDKDLLEFLEKQSEIEGPC